MTDDDIHAFCETQKYSDVVERTAKIFMPQALRRQTRIWKSGKRFVHYTSAAAAMSIIRNNEIWMRKASGMNDFREVQHGLDCLIAAYRHEKSGQRFKAVVNKIEPGITDEIEALFNGWVPDFLNGTYLTCLSEHEEVTENQLGRLSMWRAYGGDIGVAMVVNMTPFYSAAGTLAATTSPVEYIDESGFRDLFDDLTDNIEKDADFVKSLGRETLKGTIFHTFRFATLGTKHPGFAEEKEWRIIYAPGMTNSPHMKQETVIVAGVPQVVQKIPLKNIEGELVGAALPELLERLIIGPTQFPYSVYEAFVDLLTKAGVENAGSKVIVSTIPLRRGI